MKNNLHFAGESAATVFGKSNKRDEVVTVAFITSAKKVVFFLDLSVCWLAYLSDSRAAKIIDGFSRNI